MATLLYRLGRTAYRRWPVFVAGWVVLLVALGAFAAGFSKPLTTSYSIPDIPSEEAAQLQAELFPGSQSAFDAAYVNVAVQAPEGQRLDRRRYRRAIAQLTDDLAALPQQPDDVSIVGPMRRADEIEQQVLAAAKEGGADRQAMAQADREATAVSPLSPDGRTGLITFEWDVESPLDIEAATLGELEEVMSEARGSGLAVESNGPGATIPGEPGLASELVGIGVALLVLVLTFGSLIAAGMPLLNAVFGVGVGLTGVTAMTAFFDIDSSANILASMIGLAVGIDYTLFILARYRAELHHTDDRREAVGVAVGTAGSAVVFAGLTVLIALAALTVVGIPFLTSMGLASAATVFVAVLVALTLLPALLGMLKSKAFAGRVRRYRPARDQEGRVLNNGVRWGRFVGRRPVAVAVFVVVVLGALAVPLKDLQLAFPTDSARASDTTQRRASDLVADSFGAGREAPLLIVVDAREADPRERGAAFARVAAWAGGMDGVENAQVVAVNGTVDEQGAPTAPVTGALVQVLPEFGPADERALDLLDTIRDDQSAIEEATGATIGVTGLTAITTDVSDRLAGALPTYLAIIIGLAFFLLVLVFRSILVPLTATLGFLLSVLATLGLTVAVFQKGAWGLLEGQPLVSSMPVFLIGLSFGLAMDYQVFLVTRMREAHVHGMSTREAVVDGFRNSARVVSAAATIMIAVFAAFMLIDDPVVRSIGFALAVAILLDAFLVRMALIPALLYLLGEKAWWMPAWLDRVLPAIDVEGEKLERPHLAAGEHALSEADLDEAADDSDVLV